MRGRGMSVRRILMLLKKLLVLSIRTLAAALAGCLIINLSFSFHSCGKTQDESPDRAGWSCWMELPELPAGGGYEVFRHYMDVENVRTRNYTFCYSYADLVSVWVAYPLSVWNMGEKVGRSDEWAFDPLLPAEKQQDVGRAYRKADGGRWYSRGHQIPSADRQGTRRNNASTFYSTNITPQNNDFNGGLWADLETKVRKWASASDTLYVVTGCVTEDSSEYALDLSGRKVTVPSAYFKALLSYISADSPHDSPERGEFIGCAFWFNHEEYGKRPASVGKVKPEMAITIAELEKRLGYRLFPGLDEAIGKKKAAAVRKSDPLSLSWFWR